MKRGIRIRIKMKIEIQIKKQKPFRSATVNLAIQEEENGILV